MKKFLALMCVLAVMLGLALFTPTPVEAADNTYQVGYARVDVNPYNVDGDFSSGIMALPLRGSGDVWNRLSTKGLVDDNGDGVVDENDGLKATCVAVSDHNGKTILLINIDLIGGTLINKVNAAIVARLQEEQAAGKLTDVNLAKEAIYYGGTHTHNAPDTTVYTAAGKTGTNSDGVSLKEVNENLGIWIDRTIEDVADAAILALNDRAAATASKDQLSASDATSEAVKGKTMLSTRHYINGEDGSVAGDNFNDRGSNPTQVTDADDTMYLLRFDFKDSTKLPVILTGWRSHPSLNNSDTYENGGRNCMSSDYVNAYRHALEFGVDVQVNTDHTARYVTSWELGSTQKYRVIFFNGTGGNTNPRGYELEKDEDGNVLTYGSGTKVRAYSWIDLSADNAAIKGRGNSYGMVLATMAEECLSDGKNASAVSYGEIKTMQKKFTTPRKQTGISRLSHNAGVAYQASDALYDAALSAYNTANSKFSAYKTAYNNYANASKYLQWMYKSAMENALSEYNTANAALTEKLTAYEEYMEANFVNTASQASTSTVNGNKGPTKPLQTHPMIYKEGDETFAIGSRFHASNLVSSWNTKLDIPKTGDITVTLNTVMMGKDLAFVVIPGEPFDYYFKEYGNYTPENNLWHILNDETYGKPIVLGYTNGADGYFPNYEAYFYNEGRTDKAIGSYETQNNTKEAGTGEKMIYELHSMLAAMNGEDRTAYCEHCKKDAVWTPFAGQALETGHYYLCSDYENSQVKVSDGITVCFDLNGYTFKGSGRAFYNDQNAASADAKATLSILDTSAQKTGVVTGCGGDIGAARGFGGGTIIMGTGHELNIYGGIITGYQKENNSVSSGTVLMIRGTINMYGGEIIGGIASSAQGDFWFSSKINSVSRTGMGGALYLTGTLNMYGGRITGGSSQLVTSEVIGSDELGYANKLTVTTIDGPAPCVAVSTYSSYKGQVNLYNDASITHIYFNGLAETQFKVHGNYTGTAVVEYSGKTDLQAGSLVGIALADDAGAAANVSRSNISVKNVENLVMAVSGNNLVLAEHPWSYGHCQGCNKTVQWQPMNNAELNVYNGVGAGATKLPAGHYRLDENVLTDQKQLNAKGDHPGTFCIDLAGHTFTGKTRAIYTYDDTVLNIMDSVGGGVVEAKSGNNMGGGVIYLQGNTTCNLYGGTIRHNNEAADYVLNGGCIRINGASFYMYGGTLEGVDVSDKGGVIYTTLRNSIPAHVEILGGTLVNAPSSKGTGDGIYMTSGCTLVIANDATIGDVYIAGTPESTLTVDTTKAAFTGSVQVTCATEPAGGVLGTVTGTKGITAGSVTLAGSSLPVIAEDGKLLAKLELKSFHLVDAGGVYATFDTFAEALAAYTYDETRGNYIQLTKDVSKAEFDRNVIVDLNGFYLSQPTVYDTVILYVMDSQTNDFTIDDEMAYGMVYNPVVDGEGMILGLPVESNAAGDGYLMIREGKGYSFHRVTMRIKAMSLRATAAGVYYTCDFRGDEVVMDNVKTFGIALSAMMEPTSANMKDLCVFTAQTEFVSGESQGVLLSGIMKSSNTADKNRANGETAVYGRPYIETEDGYTFGTCVTRTLRQQMEDIDLIWDSLTATQQAGVLAMYGQFADAMADWNIPNIKNA